MRGRPANENEPASAAMTASLRRKPSKAPYVVAFGLSLLWVFLWFWSFSPAILDRPNAFAPQARPQTMIALATLVLPMALLWTTAWFVRRAQQMRQVSEVLVQTAMRLVRPQDIAADGLASIAQAVRSEVDILVGGVEHAVTRASELEGIVHKEIAAIERAFGGNEERIRTLVSGLENQRAALQQAGVVIGTETNPVLARLENNTQNLDAIISNAQSTLSHLEHGLKSTTVELARTIDEVASRASVAGSEISGQAAHMERSSSIFVTELRKFSEHLTEQIGILANATGSLNAESSNFGIRIQGMESNVVELLRSSVGELTSINGQIAHTIDQATASSSDQIRMAGTQLTELLQSASGNIVYHLKATSQEVTEQIEKSGLNVSQQIEASRTGMTDGLEGVVKTYVTQVEQACTGLTSFVEMAGEQIAGRVEESTGRLF
ncbi:MAG TPA: hypothetical protein VL101_05260, partial [Nordella sp.]|nr:hypothetical protein [Nordella sp.]